jgi:hypothetical protein
LDEVVRLSKFPIWNETTPLDEPEAPVLMAERLVVDDGQYHVELGEEQFGSRLPDGDGKNSPFDPLSM